VRLPKASDVTVIVNTGDDTVMHGLHISPDIDTVTYTLAEAIDPQRGWGLADESWNAMANLGRYAPVIPDGSSAGQTWFNLGDRDLATHLYRTARLAEGATLADVTDEIARAWDLPVRIIPMTNDRVRTMVTRADGATPREIPFQEYFVKLRHDVPVESIRFDGADAAMPLGLDALEPADAILIAPSNPLVSIAPLRSLAGVDDLLRRRRDHVVAVSPIVAGSALKGPADRLMRELGHEPSVVGVARLYAPIASALVIDEQDAALATAVESEGIRCIVTNTIMSTPEITTALARTCIEAVS
jgi:LPPG:FO 2-phospho-L-lactate transferase